MAEEKKTTLEKAARLYAIPHYMKDIDVNHIEEYPYDSGLEAAFIAGAKWQEAHTPLPEDAVIFQKGIEEGKRLVMEDAVEGRAEEVTFNNGEKHNTVFYSINEGTLTSESRIWIPYMGLKDGNKVKIIIVKEEEK